MRMLIRRLTPEDAAEIVACFQRVYGDSYANELYYDPELLAQNLRDGAVRAVGAILPDARIVGHMAMTIGSAGGTPELGNTVVDPLMRGAGLAWQVGNELTDWCRQLGHTGFLHYPTTEHHIMQQQSIRQGFETGLMLGYIPAETDGKVNADHAPIRAAATIVYQPLTPGETRQSFLPLDFERMVRDFSSAIPLPRSFTPSTAMPGEQPTRHSTVLFRKRQLSRLTVTAVGRDFSDILQASNSHDLPCRQIDFSMDDAAIGRGVAVALQQKYRFCGWLPGLLGADALRLQWIEPSVTDMQPKVVNPVAMELLKDLTG